MTFQPDNQPFWADGLDHWEGYHAVKAVSAGRLSFLSALALILVFVVLGGHQITASIAARDQLSRAERAQRVSDAYQEARFQVYTVETLGRRYVTSPDPAVRREFDNAVESALMAFENIRKIGSTADQQFVDDVIAKEMPEFRVVQDFFRSVESNTPFTGTLPSADISTRVRADLDQLAESRQGTANALLAAEAQGQRDRLEVTLAAYAGGLVLVAILLVAVRLLGNRDARRRAEIAERQRSLEFLRQSEERYRRLIESSPVAMLVHREGKVFYANRALGRLLGIDDPSSLSGTRVEEMVPPDSRERSLRWTAGASSTEMREIPSFEDRVVHASGELIPVEISVAKTLFDGTPMSIATLTDLSAQKETEARRLATERELLESQKLRSLAVLAGGVAHDFNNLLVGVLGNASLAAKELPAPSPAHDAILDIELAAHRGAALARQMLAYSGKGRFLVERIDINQLIEETSNLAVASTLRRVPIRFVLTDSDSCLDGDATQLRQVIMNLVMNAAEAVEASDAEITISTRVEQFDSAALGQLYLGEDLPPGEYVCIEVKDTGVGMTPEVKSRIFEPFFTTKFSGRGLGLSAVMGIVRGHRGAIRLDSDVGAGTVFKVVLPRGGMPGKPTVEPISEPTERAEMTGTVLVIDDEPLVRSMTSRAPKSFGMRVLTAVDGLEGVETFADHGDEIVCVLLDLTMPRMSGDEAFRAIRAIRQDARIVVMSGFDEQTVEERFAGQSPTAFLHKPFGPETLSEVITRAMTQSPT